MRVCCERLLCRWSLFEVVRDNDLGMESVKL
jgi:hypothetical protein